MEKAQKYFAIAIAIALSGCRVGNNVVAPTGPDNPDQISGYYQTAPQALTFCQNSIGQSTQCASAATNLVPTLLTQFMGNPIGLLVQDLNSGKSVIFNPKLPKPVGLPVYVGGTNGKQISVLIHQAQSVLWNDTTCTWDLSLMDEGEIQKFPSPETFEGFPTVGRAPQTITVIYQTFGDCSASFQAVASCYNDVNQCLGADAVEKADTQNYFQEILSPFLQSGAVTLQTLPNVTNLSYEVEYQ